MTDVTATSPTVSLTERLGMTDTTLRSSTIPLTESLGITGIPTTSLTISLVERLGISAASTITASVSLTERLGIVHTTTTSPTVSLTENLGINDTLTVFISAKLLTESLGITDTVRVIVTTKSLVEDLGFIAVPTSATNLASNQILINIPQASVTVDQTNVDLVVAYANTALETIIITNNFADISIDYSRIQSGNTVTLNTGPTILADIDTTHTGNDVEIEFSDATTITGPSGWDGTLELPTITTATISAQETTSGTTTTTTTYSDITVIEIGLTNSDLSFNSPVRIEFLGDGNNQGFIGFVRAAGTSSVTILSLCVSNPPTLTSGQACYVEEGANLVVYTTHFTAIGSAKATSTSASASTSTAGSSGGGGGGGGGSTGTTAGQAGFGGKLNQPITIYEISYNTCDKNIVKIIVGVVGTEAPSPYVKIRTSEKVYAATLIQDQPYAEANKSFSVSRYVYEAQISSNQKYFIVTAEQASGRVAITDSYLVNIDQCKKTITVNSMKDIKKAGVSEPTIEIGRPNIFDVKFQVKGNKPIPAATINQFVELGTQVKIISIVDSISTLKRAELRVITAGGNYSNYAAIKMDIMPLNTTNTYVISAELPTLFLQAPAIVYWIIVTNNDAKVQSSEKYYLGVKPTYRLDAELKLDSSASKAQGSTYRPTAYVYNKEETPLFGSVSLLVDDKEVYTSSEYVFNKGQSVIDLE
ncbi:MAG TPA: hypothetical protein VIG05_00005, partial [Candidatus Nitrosotenuis sp.]